MKRPIWRRFAAVALLGACLALVPSSAASDPGLNICPAHLSPEPEIAGTGVSAIVTPPLRVDNESSWDSGGRYQQYGTAGINWHTVIDEDCLDPKRALLLHDRANLLMDIARVGTDVVIFVYQLAASDMATDWLGKLLDPVVSGFREGFFRPLIGVVTMIGTIWLAWVGLIRKRATLTIEGTVWMCFSIAVGLWVMAAPSSVVSVVNGLTNGATVLIHDSLEDTPLMATSRCMPDGVTVGFQGTDAPSHFGGGGTPRDQDEWPEEESGSGVTGVPSDESSGDGSQGDSDSEDIGGRPRPSDEPSDDPSAIDPDGEGGESDDEDDPTIANPTASPDPDKPPPDINPSDLQMAPMSSTTDIGMAFGGDEATWEHSEIIFSSLLCEPWSAGAFGVGGESGEAARLFTAQALRSQAFTQEEREAWGTGGSFNPDARDAALELKANEYMAVTEQVYHYYPESWPSWSGDNQGNRISIGVVAVLGMLIGGSLIGAISVAILIIKMGIYLLLMLSPVVFLIGIHPGYGRKVLLTWAEYLAGFFLKQVFLVLTLVVFLIFYSWVFALPFPWFLKLVLIALLVALVVKGRKYIARTMAAASPGAIGRAFQGVADDKSLRWGAMTNPAVFARVKEREAANKIKKAVPMVIGAMTGGVGAAVSSAVGGSLGQKSPDAAPPLGGTGPTPTPTRKPAAAPPRPGAGGGRPGPPPRGGGPRPGGGPTPPGGPRPHGGGPTPAPLEGPGGPTPPAPPPPPSPTAPRPGGGGTPPTGPGTRPGQGGTTPPPTTPPRGGRGGDTFRSPLGGRRVVIHRDGAPPLEVPRNEVIDEVVEEHRPAPPPPPPPSFRTVRRRRVIRWDRPLSTRWGRGGTPPPRE